MTTIPTTKVRLRFAKRGDLRLVSHHDLMRCLERMLRRADLPVAHSQGFNPRPKATFALALALGIEGRREVMDLELTEAMDPEEVLRRLSAEAPPGFDFLEVEPAGAGRSARVVAASYRVNVPEGRRDSARIALAELLACEHRPYLRRREGREIPIDLRPFVIAADLDPEGSLQFRMKIAQDGSARPEEVVETLGLRDLLTAGAILVRTDVELLAPEGRSSVAQGETLGSPSSASFPLVSHPEGAAESPRGESSPSDPGFHPGLQTVAPHGAENTIQKAQADGREPTAPS